MKKKCAFESCERASRSRGLCEGHYSQLQRGCELRPLGLKVVKRCEFPDCGKLMLARGLCTGHYRQWSHGQELRPLARRRLPSEDTFEWFQSMLRPNGSCLEWTGATDGHGYGHLQWKRRSTSPHRLAYTLAHGEIPDGLVIDHMCWNPLCCNVKHLRTVTTAENMQNRSPVGNANNTSGIRGVSQDSYSGHWYASAKLNFVNHWRGPFDTRWEAAVAAVELRAELFTHSVEARDLIARLAS